MISHSPPTASTHAIRQKPFKKENKVLNLMALVKNVYIFYLLVSFFHKLFETPIIMYSTPTSAQNGSLSEFQPSPSLLLSDGFLIVSSLACAVKY